MRMWVQSLTSLSGLRIRCCRKLWYTLKTLLNSMWLWLWCRPAAEALDSMPSLGTSTCCGYRPKKKKKKKRQEIKSAGEDAEKREPLHTVGGNVNWHSHYGKQYGGFFKRLTVEGSSCCGSTEMNLTSNHEDADSILGLAHCVKELVLP